MRIDELFGGVALAYFHHFKIEIYNRLTGNFVLALAALLIIPTTLLPYTGRVMQTIGLTSLTLAFILIVAWSVVRPPKGKYMQLLLGGAARIGVYSYSIYLWHMAFADLIGRYVLITVWKFWFYIISCITGGMAKAYLVEIPYLRLRDRLFPAASAVVVTLKTVIWTYQIS